MYFTSNTFIVDDSKKELAVPLIIDTLDNGSIYSHQDEFKTIIEQIHIHANRISSEALASIKDFLITNDDISDSEKDKIYKNINYSKIVAFYLSYSTYRDGFIFSSFISDTSDYVWDVGFNADSISVIEWKIDYIEHGDDINSFKKCYGI